MGSGFIHTTIDSHYSGLADLIQQTGLTLKIVKRYPASGIPPEGIPFMIDIEVQTERLGTEAFTDYRNWFSFGGVTRCKDALVVARGRFDKAGVIYGYALVETSTFSSCLGTARLTFNQDFIPDSKHWIALEVYDQHTKIDDVESGKAKPIAQTAEFLFNKSEAESKNAGLISTPTPTAGQSITKAVTSVGSGVQEATKLVTRIAIVAAIGAGLVFVAPHAPLLSKGVRDGINGLKKAFK